MKKLIEKTHRVLFLKRQIPAYWLVLIFVLSTSGTILISATNKHHLKPPPVTTVVQDEGCMSAIRYERMTGYQYARPLFLTNVEVEDNSLTGLKALVINYIESEKKLGHIQSASVYFKKLDTPSWFAVNPDEDYICASLFKVQVMIALLMEEDKEPGFLNRKMLYTAPAGFSENVQPLEKGKYYSLGELIKSMVSRSDNIAYDLCWKNMPIINFEKIIKDFQIKPFSIYDTTEYTMSVTEYSKFFRALYNAGYLSKKMSDYALKKLAESDFTEGLMKDMKGSFPVARKFGLRVSGNNTQLHEFGIFYFDREPYLLGVMTKGGNLPDLYPVLSTISAMVYNEVKLPATPNSSSASLN